MSLRDQKTFRQYRTWFTYNFWGLGVCCLIYDCFSYFLIGPILDLNRFYCGVCFGSYAFRFLYALVGSRLQKCLFVTASRVYWLLKEKFFMWQTLVGIVCANIIFIWVLRVQSLSQYGLYGLYLEDWRLWVVFFTIRLAFT